MSEVVVYGASDDLVEIDGAISEEFPALNLDDMAGGYLAFSDGTVLRIVYDDDGFWRVNRRSTGTAEYEKREATDGDSDYSDRVTLRGDLRWIVFGTEYVTASRGPKDSDGGA